MEGRHKWRLCQRNNLVPFIFCSESEDESDDDEIDGQKGETDENDVVGNDNTDDDGNDDAYDEKRYFVQSERRHASQMLFLSSSYREMSSNHTDSSTLLFQC